MLPMGDYVAENKRRTFTRSRPLNHFIKTMYTIYFIAEVPYEKPENLFTFLELKSCHRYRLLEEYTFLLRRGHPDGNERRRRRT